MFCGQLLREKHLALEGAASRSNTKPEHTKFGLWLQTNCPQISHRTAYRWMELSQRVVGHCGLELENAATPLSDALSQPESSLAPQALQWRQTIFAFLAGKTMKEAIAGVVVEGDEPHRLTRSFNGKSAGGYHGENRRDYARYLASHFQIATKFLNEKISPAQKSKISAAAGQAVQHWPRWFLAELAENLKTELKLSDEQRAAR
jgi:hypothetical protein